MALGVCRLVCFYTFYCLDKTFVKGVIQNIKPLTCFCNWAGLNTTSNECLTKYGCLKACHTKWRFHCVGTVFFNFSEHRESPRNSWCISWKKRLSWRPHSNQGIATELLWLSIMFLRSSCWGFIVLSRRAHCVHCAFTAFALCLNHGACTALTAWHLKMYANIKNSKFSP